MARGDHGYWELRAAGVRTGDHYRYRLDGDRTLLDLRSLPASADDDLAAAVLAVGAP